MITDHTEIDHIKPLWDGGDNALDNLQVLCFKCHREKSAQEHKRWSRLNPIILIKDGVVVERTISDGTR